MSIRFSAHRVAVLLLSALFFCLVFYGFPDSSAPWFDEGINLNLAKSWAESGVFSLQTGPNEFVAERSLLISTNYPLLSFVALSFKLFGAGLWQGKIVMYIFLSLFIFLAYAFCKKYYGKTAALLVLALLITFLPLYGNGKSVLGEIPGLVYFLAGLLILDAKSRRLIFLSGLLFGLAAATKPSYLIILAAIAVGEIYSAFRNRELNFKRWLMLCGGLAIPMVIWIYTLIPDHLSQNFLYQTWSLYSNPYNARGTVLLNLKRFFTESTPVHFLLLLLAIVIWKGLKKLNLSSVEVVVVTFIFLNFIFYLNTVGWYRYFFPGHVLAIILLPAALIGIMSSVGNQFWKNYGAWAIVIFLVLAQAGVLLRNIGDQVYYDPVPRQFSERANQILGNQEVFVIDDPEIAFLLKSSNANTNLSPNPHVVFGRDLLRETMPRYIISSSWAENRYLNNYLNLKDRYDVAYSLGHYNLYSLNHVSGTN